MKHCVIKGASLLFPESSALSSDFRHSNAFLVNVIYFAYTTAVFQCRLRHVTFNNSML